MRKCTVVFFERMAVTIKFIGFVFFSNGGKDYPQTTAAQPRSLTLAMTRMHIAERMFCHPV